MAEISRYSIYRNSFEREDEDGYRYTTDAEIFLFEELPDNIEHVVEDGQSWGDIAYMYWKPIPQAKSYWRALAEFQPEPVTDPFIPPKAGTIVYVPSRLTFETKILKKRTTGTSGF